MICAVWTMAPVMMPSRRSLSASGWRSMVGILRLPSLPAARMARAAPMARWSTVLLGDPERPDARRDADGHLEGPEEALRRPGPADAVDPPEGPGRLLAEEQVFVHPELGDEVELLVDRADPGVLGLARRPDVYLPALEEDHPPVGPVDPDRILIRVDLPAPFSPTSTWTSPARRSKSTSRSATTPGKAFVMPRISRSAGDPPRVTAEPPSRTGSTPSDRLGGESESAARNPLRDVPC